MDNPVVVRGAEVAQALGLATLRFNFRGAGRSTGTHGGGLPEMEDVRAALLHLAAMLPRGATVGVLGYSFGAWVSARVAAIDPRPLCLVAPPLKMLDWSAGPPARPDVCVLAGTRDSYCALPELDQFLAKLPGVRHATIEGADHFFFGKLYPLGEEIGAWCRGWASGSAPLPGQPRG
jgi:alpha/beta superfamily hydrolase